MMNQLPIPEFKAWIAEGKEFLLVDVREDFERELFHIGGIHIPMNELIARVQELKAGRPVVFYCEKGIRSTIAMQRLELLGLEMYSLTGGMSAWKKMED
jgi:rhodanese-related sulfurtransferase